MLAFNPHFRNVMNSVLDDDRVFPHQSTSDHYMSQTIYFPNIYKYIYISLWQQKL